MHGTDACMHNVCTYAYVICILAYIICRYAHDICIHAYKTGTAHEERCVQVALVVCGGFASCSVGSGERAGTGVPEKTMRSILNMHGALPFGKSGHRCSSMTNTGECPCPMIQNRSIRSTSPTIATLI